MSKFKKESIIQYIEKNKGVSANVYMVLPNESVKIDESSGLNAKIINSKYGSNQIVNMIPSDQRKNPEKEDTIKRIVSDKRDKVSQIIYDMQRIYPIYSELYFMSTKTTENRAVMNITSLNIEHDYFTGGLFDKRLGTIEESKNCITCYRNYNGCEGHEGYIQFEYPHVNPISQDEVILYLVVRCEYCGHVYATEDFIKAAGLDKVPDSHFLKRLAEYTPYLAKLHNHPGYERPIYNKKMEDHKVTYKKGGHTYEQPISNIKYMFDNFDANDLKILRCDKGRTKPSDHIMCGILTVPPQLRLPGFVQGKMVNNFLTDRYIDIIKYNYQLKSLKGGNEDTKNNILANQYSKIKEIFFGSENKALTKISDKDEGILKYFNKKEGLIRQNATGKRVDFSARTVIDPGNKWEWVGIPKSFTNILTIPEHVNVYNIKKISERILSGEYKTVIVKNNGVEKKYNITQREMEKFQIKIGQIIERPFEEGDPLLVNRQPSLHGPSLVGNKGYIHDDENIKFNSSGTGSMNADFDGDEMTLHLPQSIEAQVECMTIASTKYNILGAQSNKPIMAPAYYNISGPYIMTENWKIPEFDKDEFKKNLIKENSKIDDEKIISTIKKHADEIIKNSPPIEVMIPDRRWPEALSVVPDSHRKESLEKRCKQQNINIRSGRALISLSFPVNLTYSGYDLEIKNGILVKGVLRKGNLNALVQIISKLFSIEEGSRFIGEICSISDWFIMWHGFTMGHWTFTTNRSEIITKIRNELNRIQAQIYNIGNIPTDNIDKFFWKKKAHTMIDKVQNFGKIIGNSYLDKNNALNILGSDGSGAKGSYMNTGQITGALGLQRIKGDFQKNELNEKTRSLPIFLPNDSALESFGFVMHSFFDGLTPSDMFFHIVSGREGLVDTANNTAESGYTHRRVEKAAEDLFVNSRGMVTSSTGRIFQFSIDCMNSSYQVFTKTPEYGKVLNFCDYEDLAKMTNSIYEYIDRYCNSKEYV